MHENSCEELMWPELIRKYMVLSEPVIHWNIAILRQNQLCEEEQYVSDDQILNNRRQWQKGRRTIHTYKFMENKYRKLSAIRCLCFS